MHQRKSRDALRLDDHFALYAHVQHEMAGQTAAVIRQRHDGTEFDSKPLLAKLDGQALGVNVLEQARPGVSNFAYPEISGFRFSVPPFLRVPILRCLRPLRFLPAGESTGFGVRLHI
jgi:hypothetical protein